MDRLSDYDYVLPDELIAQIPLEDRSASRLLWLQKSGIIAHRRFQDSLQILEPGDLLVLNDTRVSAVRLFGHRDTGASVEALLLKDLGFGRFEALVKPGKRLKPGARIEFEEGISANVELELGEGLKQLSFDSDPDFDSKLDRIGLTPLPPYIHTLLPDRERYQTVYGVASGSAAAPTAGLHFTPDMLGALGKRGVETAHVTLHVGIDTFRPVQAEDLSEHRMHGERCVLPAETAERIQNAKGRIIAVGTTTVRTLESFAISPRRVEAGEKNSTLFIRPGFNFQVVDGMFTNFHLPKTTMLMMISAMAGAEAMKAAYREAVEAKYRFLSFGDSMLIL